MANEKPQPRFKAAIVIGCIALLGAVYVFQKTDYLKVLLNLLGSQPASPNITFAVNKTFRMVVNDLLCMGLIYAWFYERKYLKIAFILFCIELFVILPAYLVVKLSLEGDSEISSPLLSQIHRLIVNPMLMLILMAGFYYQRNGLPRSS